MVPYIKTLTWCTAAELLLVSLITLLPTLFYCCLFWLLMCDPEICGGLQWDQLLLGLQAYTCHKKLVRGSLDNYENDWRYCLQTQSTCMFQYFSLTILCLHPATLFESPIHAHLPLAPHNKHPYAGGFACVKASQNLVLKFLVLQFSTYDQRSGYCEPWRLERV